MNSLSRTDDPEPCPEHIRSGAPGTGHHSVQSAPSHLCDREPQCVHRPARADLWKQIGHLPSPARRIRVQHFDPALLQATVEVRDRFHYDWSHRTFFRQAPNRIGRARLSRLGKADPGIRARRPLPQPGEEVHSPVTAAPYTRASSLRTGTGTKPDTSPPSRATSRTSDELRNV